MKQRMNSDSLYYTSCVYIKAAIFTYEQFFAGCLKQGVGEQNLWQSFPGMGSVISVVDFD